MITATCLPLSLIHLDPSSDKTLKIVPTVHKRAAGNCQTSTLIQNHRCALDVFHTSPPQV